MSTKEAVAILAGGVLVVSLLSNTKTTQATAASPLANSAGTRPGLAPLTTTADKTDARAMITRLRIKTRGPGTGYERTKYGDNWADTADTVPYAHNGCRTRDDLLARDGTNLTYKPGSHCDIIALRLTDPYTGRTIDWHISKADEIQVDHVVPLAYAWHMGATHWSKTKRIDFANDPLELLPVDGAANEQKDAQGPANWLPPQKSIRCAYVTRFAQVALKYDLPVTKADKDTMLKQCR